LPGGVVGQQPQARGGGDPVVEGDAALGDGMPALERAGDGHEGQVARAPGDLDVAASSPGGDAEQVGGDRPGEPAQGPPAGDERGCPAPHDRALDDDGGELGVAGGGGEDVAGAEGGAPQRDPAGVKGRVGCSERQRRVQVLALTPHAQQLAGLAV
jgi:hypothetical protein